jgi:hypothetical protein
MTTTKALGLDLRYQLALRDAVARAQARGFELISREHLTLRRGRATLTLQGGVLVEGLDPVPREAGEKAK